jgi:hypothetical protein
MLREGPALNEAELVDLMDKKKPLITGGKNVLRDVYRAAIELKVGLWRSPNFERS